MSVVEENTPLPLFCYFSALTATATERLDVALSAQSSAGLDLARCMNLAHLLRPRAAGGARTAGGAGGDLFSDVVPFSPDVIHLRIRAFHAHNQGGIML